MTHSNKDEGLMLKLKLQYFGHLMRRTDSLEKTLMLGKTEGGRRRGIRIRIRVSVSVSCSVVSDFSATPWTVACQASLFMEFSRPEYWSGLPFPSSGDPPNPGIEPEFPAWQADNYLHIQFSSVTQLCPTRCDPTNRSTPGLPVHHQLPEFTQTHVYQVGDAI